MIRPTRRAIIALSGALGVSVLPVLEPAWWPAWVGYVGFVLTVATVDALTTLRRRDLEVHVDAPETAYVGTTVTAPVTITTTGLWRPIPMALRLEMSAPLNQTAFGSGLLSATSRTEHCRMVVPLRLAPERRGTARLQSLWLRWTGPLGLVDRTVRVELERELQVVPNVAALNEALALAESTTDRRGAQVEAFLGEGSEFDTLREFAPGFDHRAIDWKATARRRKLMVRQHRAERNHHVVLAFDTGYLMRQPLPIDDTVMPKLDHAISAGITVAHAALRTGDRVSLAHFDARLHRVVGPFSGVRGVGALQHAAAELEYSSDETNYARSLSELALRLRRRSLIILFTDFVDSVTAELMLDYVSHVCRRHLLLFVSLRDMGLEAERDRRPISTLQLHRSVTAAELLREREIVIRRLRRLGALVVDAEPDRLTPALLNQYVDVVRRELV